MGVRQHEAVATIDRQDMAFQFTPCSSPALRLGSVGLKVTFEALCDLVTAYIGSTPSAPFPLNLIVLTCTISRVTSRNPFESERECD